MTTIFAQSALSLVAVIAYIAAAASCIQAYRLAVKARRPKRERMRWPMLAMLLIALGISRLLGAEERFRTAARVTLQAQHEYVDRWDLQAPIAAGIVVALGALGLIFYLTHGLERKIGRLGQAMILADAGGFALCGLVMLRMTSLHAVDAILFRGPHLNWVIDFGGTIAIGWAALRYRKLLVAARR